MEKSQQRVHSQSIQDALTQASHSFHQYALYLNKMSEDMKAVEAYLKSNHLPIPYSMTLDLKTIPDIDPGIEQLVLYWARRKTSGEFRLLCYEEYCLEVEDESTGQCHVHQNEEEKPLIECRAEMRIIVYPFLPQFIRSFAEYVESLSKTDLATQK